MLEAGTSNFAAIDAAVARSYGAQVDYAAAPHAVRSTLLRGLADALGRDAASLVALANEETSLGAGRLNGELARTAFQLRGFADRVDAGIAARTVDDAAVAGAPPAGRPHLTRVFAPLGPVAMFAASNFPFAFSVLGGDTASALAAGCAVIVKPHSGHPELSRRVHALAAGVLREQGLPEGVIGFVEASREAAVHLVSHPDVGAVAFTGSYQGGVALWKAVNARARPIPFYGELGSINPLVVTPQALTQDVETPAATLAASIALGCGQLCTSPGVIVVRADGTGTRFVEALARSLAAQKTHAMLTLAMHRGFERATEHIAAQPGVVTRLAAQAGSDDADHAPTPRLFEIDAQSFVTNAALHEEMFGPAALVVRARHDADVLDVLTVVEGTLTVTLWGAEADTPANRALAAAAQRIAGRVLFRGVPTGVAVCDAQQHGGPWPASTQPQTTSVGYAAIERFLRPVALQDAPAWAIDANRGGATV
ncbi:aldehyde dehydrogenase (NADP(+)) [Paraburkholderia aspalathi]|nr:aldehyde dehydrogenase (NADP(+)) [Paraburkholderia aspalathi]